MFLYNLLRLFFCFLYLFVFSIVIIMVIIIGAIIFIYILLICYFVNIFLNPLLSLITLIIHLTKKQSDCLCVLILHSWSEVVLNKFLWVTFLDIVSMLEYVVIASFMAFISLCDSFNSFFTSFTVWVFILWNWNCFQ